jgi:hypothetical protein
MSLTGRGGGGGGGGGGGDTLFLALSSGMSVIFCHSIIPSHHTKSCLTFGTVASLSFSSSRVKGPTCPVLAPQ